MEKEAHWPVPTEVTLVISSATSYQVTLYWTYRQAVKKKSKSDIGMATTEDRGALEAFTKTLKCQ